MILLIGFIPTLLYIYLAWVCIRVISRYNGLLVLTSAFMLLDVLYYGAVNAIWFKDALSVKLDYIDMIWAFQEALDVFCMLGLLVLVMRVVTPTKTDVSTRAEWIFFLGFIVVYLWLCFGVFMGA